MESNLIADLKLSGALLKILHENPTALYRIKDQPKTKFGVQQVDKNKNPKIRRICEPAPTLKALQRRINACLQKFDLPECMYGGITGNNNIINAGAHREGKFFLTIDIMDFFKRISNQQVHRALCNLGFSSSEARIITKLTTLNHSLPQGAPTSTTLANIVFAPTVSRLERFCGKRGITFTVFVDDLTFSAPIYFKHLVPHILNMLTKDGFYPNPNKIRHRKDRCEITGLIVKNGRLFLEKSMLQAIERPGMGAYLKAIEKANHEFQFERRP